MIECFHCIYLKIARCFPGFSGEKAPFETQKPAHESNMEELNLVFFFFVCLEQMLQAQTNLPLCVSCRFKAADARCPQVQTKQHIRPLSLDVNKSSRPSCSTGGSRVQVSLIVTPAKRLLELQRLTGVTGGL